LNEKNDQGYLKRAARNVKRPGQRGTRKAPRPTNYTNKGCRGRPLIFEILTRTPRETKAQGATRVQNKNVGRRADARPTFTTNALPVKGLSGNGPRRNMFVS